MIWAFFASLDDAVAAATVAQQGLKRVAMRQQVIQAIREAGEKYARELAELAVTETGMGRVEDKFDQKRGAGARHAGRGVSDSAGAHRR